MIPPYQTHAEDTYAKAYAQGKRLWRYSDQPNPWVIEFAESRYFPKRGGASDGAVEVVDFACGEGIDAAYLAGRGCRVTGFDVAGNAIERAKEIAAERGVAVRYLVGDMTRCPLADGCADVAMAVACIGWLLEDASRTAFMCETARVLRPGGWLVFSNGVSLEEIRTSFPEVYEDLRRRQGEQAMAEWDREERARAWHWPSQRYDTRKGYEAMMEAAGLRVIVSKLDISPEAWGCVIWARKV